MCKLETSLRHSDHNIEVKYLLFWPDIYNSLNGLNWFCTILKPVIRLSLVYLSLVNKKRVKPVLCYKDPQTPSTSTIPTVLETGVSDQWSSHLPAFTLVYTFSVSSSIIFHILLYHVQFQYLRLQYTSLWYRVTPITIIMTSITKDLHILSTTHWWKLSDLKIVFYYRLFGAFHLQRLVTFPKYLSVTENIEV